MPLDRYGVLAAQALDTRREDGIETPHHHTHLVDDGGRHWTVATNVASRLPPSDLLYLVDSDFRHPVAARLSALAGGWHPLAPEADGPHLDFVRGNLFDRAAMRLLPAAVEGPENDLADLLEYWLRRAIDTPAAMAFAFGQRFGPHGGMTDPAFGFEPSNGIHDIHMNQGSGGRFRDDNGVRQDGALILRFPAESRWVAIFLAFQSQAFHTDDRTGDPIGGGGAAAAPVAVRIIAAVVNPRAGARESVLLLNASASEVDLSGWRIADRGQHTCAVPAGPLAPGETRRVQLTDGVVLGDGGGTVTLLDAGGLKVAGVAYTAADAELAGWTVTF